MANHVEKHLGNSDTEDSRTKKKCLCFEVCALCLSSTMEASRYTRAKIWWNVDDIQQPVVLRFAISIPPDWLHPTSNFQSYLHTIQGVQIQICDAKAAHHLQLKQCVHAWMRRGQMMSAIGISNSNQSDLVQCVYIATCSFPNHTGQISVIFMHAWDFKYHDLLFKYLN